MPGWKQRLTERSRSPNRSSDVQSSAQAVTFLKDWCFGKISTPKLVEHSRSSVNDHQKHVHPVIKLLSRISNSKGTCNVLRTLKGLIIDSLIEPSPSSLVNHMVVPHVLLNALAKDTTVFKRNKFY